ALSKKLSSVFGEQETPVTSALLVANILMFGVSFVALASEGGSGGFRILWGMGGETVYRLGASYPYPIFIGHQWWRLVTAMFLSWGFPAWESITTRTSLDWWLDLASENCLQIASL